MKKVKFCYIYLIRNKKNTFMLFSVFSILVIIMLLSFIIRTTAKESISNLRKSFGGSFILDEYINQESVGDPNLWEAEVEEDGVSYQYIGPKIDDELISKIEGVSGIKDTNLEFIEVAHVKDCILCPGAWKWTVEEDDENPENAAIDIEMERYYMGNTTIYSFENPEMSSFFRTNSFEIIEGRNLNENDMNKVIISDEIAKNNNLTIGDKICIGEEKIALKIYGGISEYNFKNIEPEIIGIFRVNTNQIISRWTFEADILNNYMFVDINTMKNIKDEHYSMLGLKSNFLCHRASFFVEDPSDIEKIIADVKRIKSIDWKCFTIEIDDSDYMKSIIPLKKLEKLSTFMIVFVVVITVIVLGVIFRSWTEERKKEIGILYFLGYSRKEIVLKFILEGFLVLSVAMIIGSCITSVTCQKIGNHFLESRIVVEEDNLRKKANSEMENVEKYYVYRNETNDIRDINNINNDLSEELDFQIEWKALFYTFVLMNILMCFTTMCGIYPIVKLRPQGMMKV